MAFSYVSNFAKANHKERFFGIHSTALYNKIKASDSLDKLINSFQISTLFGMNSKALLSNLILAYVSSSLLTAFNQILTECGNV